MSPAAARRPRRTSPLENMGNPAAAAPEDDDTTPAAGGATDTPAAETNGSAATATEPAPDTAPQGAQEGQTAPAPAKPRARGAGRSPANSGRRTTSRSNSRTAAPAATAPAANTGENSPAAREVAAGAGRPGRPRVPKPGPTTRVTVDLAQSEQRELERLAGTIGRKIGRDSGKQRLYVQHLMRVATRRLISDSTFRDTIADDLADNRDELKRAK